MGELQKSELIGELTPRGDVSAASSHFRNNCLHSTFNSLPFPLCECQPARLWHWGETSRLIKGEQASRTGKVNNMAQGGRERGQVDVICRSAVFNHNPPAALTDVHGAAALERNQIREDWWFIRGQAKQRGIELRSSQLAIVMKQIYPSMIIGL